MKKLQS